MKRFQPALVFVVALLVGMNTARCATVGKGFVSGEEKLRAALFPEGSHAKATLPKNATDPPVNVAVGIYFYSLGMLDELAGNVQLSMWQRMSWKDPNLKWNPADFGED